MTIGPGVDLHRIFQSKGGSRAQLYRRMKPHVRRGRAAREKRIERAKLRLAARQKQAA